MPRGQAAPSPGKCWLVWYLGAVNTNRKLTPPPDDSVTFLDDVVEVDNRRLDDPLRPVGKELVDRPRGPDPGCAAILVERNNPALRQVGVEELERALVRRIEVYVQVEQCNRSAVIRR